MVGNVRFAGERDGHDLLRLIVVKRLQHGAMEVLNVDGSSAGLRSGGLSGTFGQSGLLGELRNRNDTNAQRRLSFAGTIRGRARG